MAGCLSKEEIHVGVGYVQRSSCGFSERTTEIEDHTCYHTRRVYVTAAAVGCMPEQAI